MAWSDGGEQARARWAADRVAVALEEVGFDVGREFPLLTERVNRAGLPVVELGSVRVEVAEQLAVVLAEAARRGVVVVNGPA